MIKSTKSRRKTKHQLEPQLPLERYASNIALPDVSSKVSRASTQSKNLPSRVGGQVSANLQVMAISNTTRLKRLPTSELFLNLQRNYGNQFVRRIVEESRQEEKSITSISRPTGHPLVRNWMGHSTQYQRYETKSQKRNSRQIQRSVSDTIPEAENQFYGHGAFMGAARELLADRKWNRILEALMPDVHADATRALRGGSGSGDIILMFENNPVMAAYGMHKTKQMDARREGGRSDRISKMKAIEWDVFLPTNIVEQFNAAGSDAERDRLADKMVDEMIIAHGTPSQTIRENAGRIGSRQYENVRGTRKSSQGGVRPGAWMDLFGRALQLATASNWEEQAAELEDPTLHPRVDSPSDQAAHQTFEDKLEFSEVIRRYREMFNKETFSVLLDIKSRDATPRILSALVQALNRRGVHVYGAGTFQHHEVAGLSGMRQSVDGKDYAGPKEVKFFHLAGDLQKALLNNRIAEGDTVMFNAGSLISYDRYARGPQKKASYQVKTEVVNQLRTFKRHYGFHLGVYVQENDIDDRAATMITELTNTNADIFDLGFAWGGLSGKTASDIEPSLTDATVGTAGQYLLGTEWNTRLPLPSAPTPIGGGFRSTISMRHRYMESRRFPVSGASVNVTCDANWNRPGCRPDTYYITLVHEKSLRPDSEKGSMGYPVGRAHSAAWSSLESGTYFLRIWFPVNTDPSCILRGNIIVST